MTIRVKAHARKGTRGVRGYVRDEAIAMRADNQRAWEAIEREEARELREMSDLPHEQKRKPLVIRQVVWP